MTFRYTVIRLWQLPAEPFLTGPLGTLPLAALTDDAEPRLAEVVGRTHERFHAELPPEEANRIEAATFVLLGLR